MAEGKRFGRSSLLLRRRPAVYTSGAVGQRSRPTRGRWLWVAALMTLVAPGGGVAARAVHNGLQATYVERIQYIGDWGRRYPGYLPGDAGPLDDVGIVAGIMLQTTWQRDSGREMESIWAMVNAGLSVQPYRLSREYYRDGDLDCHHGAFVSRHPTRDRARAPLTREDVCRAWRTYFVVSDLIRHWRVGNDPAAQSIAQRCLWDAHTKSIVHELWQHESALQAEPLPEQERRFWANWIGMVFVLADIVYPTTASVNSLFSSRLMPDCSPLGEAACQLDRFSGAQHSFLALLTAQERSIQGLIEEYVVRQDRGDPPCTLVHPADWSPPRALSSPLERVSPLLLRAVEPSRVPRPLPDPA